VACTITAHHLALTVDDWAGQGWNFCKPVAKYPDDREALRDVVKEGCRSPLNIRFSPAESGLTGHHRFFLGSDSAPHPLATKSTSTPTQGCAAGIYTSPILLPLVTTLLEEFGALSNLEGFVSKFGRAFYKLPIREGGKRVGLQKIGRKVIEESWGTGEQKVVPFWAGRAISWELEA
jgi:dihydroorotase